MKNVFEYEDANGRLVTVVFNQPVKVELFDLVVDMAIDESDLLIGFKEVLGDYKVY